MYEQYTDRQIVEMLRPKLTKIMDGMDGMLDTALEHSEGGRNLIKLIATIYRSAYIRGQLGRSFIIGEPKQAEHWIPATTDNAKVGSKVRMIDSEARLVYPDWFPVVGVTGVVTKLGDNAYEVQWRKGTTSGNDKWWSSYDRLEVLLCE